MLRIFRPCKRLSKLFKIHRRKHVSIRAFRFRSLRRRQRKSCWGGQGSFQSFQLSFCGSTGTEKIDKLGEMRSIAERERIRVPCPSPITPAYIKVARFRRGGSNGVVDNVEEACRRFENYLVDMIAEEGNVKDLMDVEELLECWNTLKSPVFVNMVCRFYGELCSDLFTNTECEKLLDSSTVN